MSNTFHSPVIGASGTIKATLRLASIHWSPNAQTVMPLRVLAIGVTLIGLTIKIGPIYYAKGTPVLD